MLHSDTPLIVEIISEGFRIQEQSIVSRPKFCVDFHFEATQILTKCFDLVNISRHEDNIGWYQGSGQGVTPKFYYGLS